MIHFMISCIVVFVFFLLFGPLIFSLIEIAKSLLIAILIFGIGITFAISLIYYLYAFNDTLGIISIPLFVFAAIFYFEHIQNGGGNKTIKEASDFNLKQKTKNEKKLRHTKNTKSNNNELSSNVIKDLSDSTTDFRAKHPFVMVNVKPPLQSQFISECKWLESKLGHFPSEADQVAILKSLGETSVV